MRAPFESLLDKKDLDKLSLVALKCGVNIDFQSACPSHFKTHALFTSRALLRPRTPCARRLSRPGRGASAFICSSFFSRQSPLSWPERSRRGTRLSRGPRATSWSRRKRCKPFLINQLPTLLVTHGVYPTSSSNLRKNCPAVPLYPNISSSAHSSLCCGSPLPPAKSTLTYLPENTRLQLPLESVFTKNGGGECWFGGEMNRLLQLAFLRAPTRSHSFSPKRKVRYQ